jgi:hypothetical protein
MGKLQEPKSDRSPSARQLKNVTRSCYSPYQPYTSRRTYPGQLAYIEADASLTTATLELEDIVVRDIGVTRLTGRLNSIYSRSQPPPNRPINPSPRPAPGNQPYVHVANVMIGEMRDERVKARPSLKSSRGA